LEQIIPGVIHKIYENNTNYLYELIEGYPFHEPDTINLFDMGGNGWFKKELFLDNVYQHCVETFHEAGIDTLLNNWIPTHFVRNASILPDRMCVLTFYPKYYFNWLQHE
jgi:hypothetical protein